MKVGAFDIMADPKGPAELGKKFQPLPAINPRPPACKPPDTPGHRACKSAAIVPMEFEGERRTRADRFQSATAEANKSGSKRKPSSLDAKSSKASRMLAEKKVKKKPRTLPAAAVKKDEEIYSEDEDHEATPQLEAACPPVNEDKRNLDPSPCATDSAAWTTSVHDAAMVKQGVESHVPDLEDLEFASQESNKPCPDAESPCARADHHAAPPKKSVTSLVPDLDDLEFAPERAASPCQYTKDEKRSLCDSARAVSKMSAHGGTAMGKDENLYSEDEDHDCSPRLQIASTPVNEDKKSECDTARTSSAISDHITARSKKSVESVVRDVDCLELKPEPGADVLPTSTVNASQDTVPLSADDTPAAHVDPPMEAYHGGSQASPAYHDPPQASTGDDNISQSTIGESRCSSSSSSSSSKRSSRQDTLHEPRTPSRPSSAESVSETARSTSRPSVHQPSAKSSVTRCDSFCGSTAAYERSPPYRPSTAESTTDPAGTARPSTGRKLSAKTYATGCGPDSCPTSACEPSPLSRPLSAESMVEPTTARSISSERQPSASSCDEASRHTSAVEHRATSAESMPTTARSTSRTSVHQPSVTVSDLDQASRPASAFKPRSKSRPASCRPEESDVRSRSRTSACQPTAKASATSSEHGSRPVSAFSTNMHQPSATSGDPATCLISAFEPGPPTKPSSAESMAEPVTARTSSRNSVHKLSAKRSATSIDKASPLTSPFVPRPPSAKSMADPISARSTRSRRSVRKLSASGSVKPSRPASAESDASAVDQVSRPGSTFEPKPPSRPASAKSDASIGGQLSRPGSTFAPKPPSRPGSAKSYARAVCQVSSLSSASEPGPPSRPASAKSHASAGAQLSRPATASHIERIRSARLGASSSTVTMTPKSDR